MGYTDEQGIRNLTHEIDLEIQEATDKALAADPPARGSAYWHLYSGSVDPTSADFDTPADFRGDPRTMVDSINLTLNEEMARDPRVLVFGEDVADCSREENLEGSER